MILRLLLNLSFFGLLSLDSAWAYEVQVHEIPACETSASFPATDSPRVQAAFEEILLFQLTLPESLKQKQKLEADLEYRMRLADLSTGIVYFLGEEMNYEILKKNETYWIALELPSFMPLPHRLQLQLIEATLSRKEKPEVFNCVDIALSDEALGDPIFPEILPDDFFVNYFYLGTVIGTEFDTESPGESLQDDILISATEGHLQNASEPAMAGCQARASPSSATGFLFAGLLLLSVMRRLRGPLYRSHS